MRTSIVAANWKMNKQIGDAIDLAAEVKRGVTAVEGVEPVICPPFTALKAVGDLLRFSAVKLGAQNMHWETGGAFTGEISPPMLKDLGCEYVLVGHSERRTHFGETDEIVHRKIAAALETGLVPIVCIGETLEERENGRAEQVVKRQLDRALEGWTERIANLVVAYEPIWAIGTGRTARPDQAQAAHAFIRKRIGEMAGDVVARGLRILYGGSVNPDNASELFGQPDVDGGLIGGASLTAASFLPIVEAAGS